MSEDKKTGGIEISFSPDMIELILSEWEEENPGKDATIDMGADEFSRRMMIEIDASARRVKNV